MTFAVDGSAGLGHVPEGGGGYLDQDTNATAFAMVGPGAADCTGAQQAFAECVGDSTGWQVNTDPSTDVTISTSGGGSNSWGSGSSNGGSFGPGSIDWDIPATATATDFLDDGTLVLSPGTSTINVGIDLGIEALAGTLDFSNTASFSFSLPAGVTYTSASTVFDTASSAPEPASLTLLAMALAGLAAAGCGRRQRGGLR